MRWAYQDMAPPARRVASKHRIQLVVGPAYTLLLTKVSKTDTACSQFALICRVSVNVQPPAVARAVMALDSLERSVTPRHQEVQQRHPCCRQVATNRWYVGCTSATSDKVFGCKLC